MSLPAVNRPRVDRLHPSHARVGSVLLVTEDEKLGEACAQLLEREGFSVLQARHSGHALLACLSGRPTDILITELSMADGSGPALAERLRRHSPNLEALYLAHAGTIYDVPNVLVRPFTCEELLMRVRACLISSRAS